MSCPVAVTICLETKRFIADETLVRAVMALSMPAD
jgi:hypothetical protein